MHDVLRLADSIQCGMVIPGQSRDDVLAMARGMEAAGFDSVWVGDHISFYVPVLESLTLLSFVAAVTSRVRLGTSVYLLPLRHPTITAKITSTLDVLSGGRLTLGIGVGGEFPPEFKASGVALDERGTRTDEGIEILRKLWGQDDVVHEGRHFQFGPITLSPKPLQPGGPKIVVGGRKGASFRRAGQLGDGYISHMCAPEHYRANLQVIDQQAQRFGRKQVEFETVAFLFAFLEDTYDKALDKATAMLEMIYNRPFRDAAKKYCLLGKPENFLEQMQAFVDAGARHFVFSVPHDPIDFIEVFSTTIRPRLGELRLPTPS